MTHLEDDTGLRRMRRTWSLGLLASSGGLVLLLLVLGFGWGDETPSRQGTAPAFALPLIDGGEVTSDDLDGRAAVINVWASWCPPCRSEAPILRRANAAADPAALLFLGVIRNDSEGPAREFIADFGLDGFDHAVDDGSFARAYGVRGIPMTFVLDRDGRFVAQHFGPISEARLAGLIREATRDAAP